MKVRAGYKSIDVKENFIDRTVGYFSPESAKRRLVARAQIAMIGGYVGASRSRRQTKEWKPSAGDADTDILFDLPTLRARSRDLVRNEPLATGAIKTKVTHIVGTGLRLHSRIDRDVLHMSDEEADAWQDTVEKEWALWWHSKDASASREQTGPDLARMIYQQYLENGDVFVNLARIERRWNPYTLALMPIEADRVCNANNAADQYGDNMTLAGGIRRDRNGAPYEYHILKQHPGNIKSAKREWDVVNAYSRMTGLPNILHIMQPTRPGQSRGIPDLAPVIEPLKQLGRYTEAELMAAVVSGLFTVFIQSQSGDGVIDLTPIEEETGGKASDKDLKLGAGALVGLGPGETISTADPGRPNTAFDGFFQAIVRQIAVGLNLPFEMLIRHFTASYSASRAALNEAWEYFMLERDWFSRNFYQEVYAVWMYEAVSSGRIHAPGYFDDPLIRWAYLQTEWNGPARQPLDEVKEVDAAQKRIEYCLSTGAAESAKMTGTLFEANVRQRGKEKKLMDAAGLTPPAITPAAKPTNSKENGGNG